MKSNFQMIYISFISILVLTGCNLITPTPTAQPYVDSTFSGYAYLDKNLNGQLDSEDTPLEGATFYVEINGVKAFGETTNKDGYAFILIPSSVDYPVMLSMEAPKDSNLKIIGNPKIIHNQTDPSPKFLFSSK